MSTPQKKLKVLLVANYPIDGQHSMLRFAEMMYAGLSERGHEVKTIFPTPQLGKIELFGPTATKWLAYIDKFISFQPELVAEAKQFDITHICDHSNALYVPPIRHLRHLITCHDLLAVRAGLGEDTFVDLNPTGKILQRMILHGLKAADLVVCDSQATKLDAERLLGKGPTAEPDPNRIRLLRLGLNRPLKVLPANQIDERLAAVKELDQSQPFLLNVSSDLRRKNRAGLLRIFSLLKDRFAGQLVIAGSPLSPTSRELAEALGVSDRIVSVADPTDERLEALYNRAFALVFPSLSEGFGWPILEAQACGCPVVCSATSSCPEAAGGAALLRDPLDEEGFAADIMKLFDQSERQALVDSGRAHAAQSSTDSTVQQYEALYYERIAAGLGR